MECIPNFQTSYTNNMSFPYVAVAVLAFILSFVLSLIYISTRSYLSIRKNQKSGQEDTKSNLEVNKNIEFEITDIEIDEDEDDMITIKIPLKYFNFEQNDEDIIIRSKEMRDKISDVL